MRVLRASSIVIEDSFTIFLVHPLKLLRKIYNSHFIYNIFLPFLFLKKIFIYQNVQLKGKYLFQLSVSCFIHSWNHLPVKLVFQMRSCRIINTRLESCTLHYLLHLSKTSQNFLTKGHQKGTYASKRKWFFSFLAIWTYILDSARIQLKIPTDFILSYSNFHLQQIHLTRLCWLHPTDQKAERLQKGRFCHSSAMSPQFTFHYFTLLQTILLYYEPHNKHLPFYKWVTRIFNVSFCFMITICWQKSTLMPHRNLNQLISPVVHMKRSSIL